MRKAILDSLTPLIPQPILQFCRPLKRALNSSASGPGVALAMLAYPWLPSFTPSAWTLLTARCLLPT